MGDEELIARLRDAPADGLGTENLCLDAADRIAALTAQVEAAPNVATLWQDFRQEYDDRIHAEKTRAEAAEADLAELTDPVAVHANMLRGTIAKPTVEQIVHLYGREAFQPMIDVAIAKALEKACLAVSEHADWPEDEHGRTEQVGLFARVINAIRAIPAADAPDTNTVLER